MKKLSFIAILAFSFSLIGCFPDPGGISYFVWVNNSNHKITLEGQYPHIRFEIQPDEYYERKDGGISNVPSPADIWNKLTVVFDDEIEVIYSYPMVSLEGRKSNVNYDIPFNPVWDGNYLQENVKNGTRWTYTFTNADYEAAKAMNNE